MLSSFHSLIPFLFHALPSLAFPSFPCSSLSLDFPAILMNLLLTLMTSLVDWCVPQGWQWCRLWCRWCCFPCVQNLLDTSSCRAKWRTRHAEVSHLVCQSLKQPVRQSVCHFTHYLLMKSIDQTNIDVLQFLMSFHWFFTASLHGSLINFPVYFLTAFLLWKTLVLGKLCSSYFYIFILVIYLGHCVGEGYLPANVIQLYISLSVVSNS